jgi:hypothetical protein
MIAGGGKLWGEDHGLNTPGLFITFITVAIIESQYFPAIKTKISYWNKFEG